MKVTLISIDRQSGQATLKFERTQGKYNSLETSSLFLNGDKKTDNQVASECYEKLKPIALQVFNNVWECRNSPNHAVIEDVPEYDEEGNIIWAERIDKTPINEDSLLDAIPPSEEPIEFIGFEYEEFPPEPKPKPQITENEKIWDTLKFITDSIAIQPTEPPTE